MLLRRRTAPVTLVVASGAYPIAAPGAAPSTARVALGEVEATPGRVAHAQWPGPVGERRGALAGQAAEARVEGRPVDAREGPALRGGDENVGCRGQGRCGVEGLDGGALVARDPGRLHQRAQRRAQLVEGEQVVDAQIGGHGTAD